jgi:hypothetical protein
LAGYRTCLVFNGIKLVALFDGLNIIEDVPEALVKFQPISSGCGADK